MTETLKVLNCIVAIILMIAYLVTEKTPLGIWAIINLIMFLH